MAVALITCYYRDFAFETRISLPDCLWCFVILHVAYDALPNVAFPWPRWRAISGEYNYDNIPPPYWSFRTLLKDVTRINHRMDGSGAPGPPVHYGSFIQLSKRHQLHVLERTRPGMHQKARIFIPGCFTVVKLVHPRLLVLTIASMSGMMGGAAASSSSSM